MSMIFLKLDILAISKDKNEERAYEIKTQDGDPAYPDPPYDMELYNYILLLPCADLSSILKDYKSLDQESIQIKYINNSFTFHRLAVNYCYFFKELYCADAVNLLIRLGLFE